MKVLYVLIFLGVIISAPSIARRLADNPDLRLERPVEVLRVKKDSTPLPPIAAPPAVFPTSTFEPQFPLVFPTCEVFVDKTCFSELRPTTQ